MCGPLVAGTKTQFTHEGTSLKNDAYKGQSCFHKEMEHSLC
jgi:hypothetical protein